MRAEAEDPAVDKATRGRLLQDSTIITMQCATPPLLNCDSMEVGRHVIPVCM